MSGHYRMTRGWMNHPMLGHQPLCRHAAWIWLIENAAFATRKIFIGNQEITLKRGQLCMSIRFLATAWHWKPARVQRYLKKLNEWNAINTARATPKDTAQTVVTICNYEKYQATPKKPDTATDTQPESRPIQTIKKDNSFTNVKGDSAADNIWGYCVNYLTSNGGNPKSARSMVGKLRKSYSDEEIFSAVQFAQKENVVDPIPYIRRTLEERTGLNADGFTVGRSMDSW